MSKRDIVVMGGSTGAADVLKMVLGALPADFPASVFVVTHVPETGGQVFGENLGRVCALPVRYPQDDEPIATGQIYLASAGSHLLLIGGRIRLGRGSRENMSRPAIDPLFRSAALEFGPRVIGVLLSGMLNDGASGLAAVKRLGGVAVVQDPQTARAPDMPAAAIAETQVDRVTPAERLAETLISLVQAPGGAPALERPDDLVLDVEIALGSDLPDQGPGQRSALAPLTCPACQAGVSAMCGADPVHCRQAAHAVTGDVLFGEQAKAVKAALHVAIRLVEERVELNSRMAKEARKSGRRAMGRLYDDRAVEYAGQAQTLRRAAVAMWDKPKLEGGG